MAGTFELKASVEQFMFNLKAGNGERILTSERYKTKSSAEGGIASVKANAPDNARYERKTSTSGQSYFVLKAKNGEIIGTSEMYSSVGARDGGIDAVKRDAPTAPTKDLTK